MKNKNKYDTKRTKRLRIIEITIAYVIVFSTLFLLLLACDNISNSNNNRISETVAIATSVTKTATSTTTITTNNSTTTTKETTSTVPEKQTTNVANTEVSTTYQEEYIVYKPDTHYIHKNTCYWTENGKVERIENTEGIEARKCNECNPEMEIVNKYVEPEPVIEKTVSKSTSNNSANNSANNSGSVTSGDRELLAQIVHHEAGSDWISTYDKAMVAAGVMNRVNDSRFPSTVYDVLTQPGQFSGFYPGNCTPTQSCYDAVDYYFDNIDSFGNHNSWWGDSYQNHFYYQ